MAKKILIIGPIGDRGGREVEAGFFAETLARVGYDVNVCSTSNITSNSQLCDHLSWDKVDSVNLSIFRRKKIYRFLAYVAWLKNRKEAEPVVYTANLLSKRLLNYYDEVEIVINQQVARNDLIIFMGQISSSYVRLIVNAVEREKKRIIFRTTGTISMYQKIPQYFEKVDLFLHHSKHNHSKKLAEVTSDFKTLDQTALNEDSLLHISLREMKVRNFIMIGEVSRHKGVDVVLQFFSANADAEDKLLVLGEGDLKADLQEKYKKEENIVFGGHVQHYQLSKYIEAAQCLIIASEAETGPLIGIEAMASGLLILSTRVGAMEERLEQTLNDFWFQRDDLKSFEIQFEKIRSLKGKDVKTIAESTRKKYIENYSNKNVAQELSELVRIYLQPQKM